MQTTRTSHENYPEVGWDGEQWLMFGSFVVGVSGPGTVPDFNIDEAVPCLCPHQAADASMLECHAWVLEFLHQIGMVGPKPGVKIVHWKEKHVVFMGPLTNHGVDVAIETIESLGLQSKAKFLLMPDKPTTVEPDSPINTQWRYQDHTENKEF